jgi:formylglycine-generating enzyme
MRFARTPEALGGKTPLRLGNRIMGLSVIVASLTAVLPAAPGGSSNVNPRDGLTYQWIPPGSYFTGCQPGDTECYGLERHREKIVAASGFWIGRTEVTQAAYMRVMNADPSYYKGPDLPADRVGWTDATTYCSRIGMRLPTESEWEYAAYGGTAELPKEPLASLAWYDPNSNDSTHPVATKLPNGYGLWDMLGNVWEWVQDAGKEPGEHILKGGSFYNTSRDVRVSGRLSAPPDLRHRDIGFRCSSSVWPEERSGLLRGVSMSSAPGSTSHRFPYLSSLHRGPNCGEERERDLPKLTTEQVHAHERFARMEITVEELQCACLGEMEFDFGMTERSFSGHFVQPKPGILITKQHIENALSRKGLAIVSERELVLWATMILLNDAYEIDSADEDLIGQGLNDMSFELDPAVDDKR